MIYKIYFTNGVFIILDTHFHNLVESSINRNYPEKYSFKTLDKMLQECDKGHMSQMMLVYKLYKEGKLEKGNLCDCYSFRVWKI